jgi:Transposase DDE domain group 1
LSKPIHAIQVTTPAMNDPMLPLPGLSSVSGKPVVVKFDGGLLSSDGGVLALREVEQRLGVADRLAACLVDPRARDQITHSLADIIRFRLLMIGAGYEDGIDAIPCAAIRCSRWRSI